jgi:fatty acid desaturase
MEIVLMHVVGIYLLFHGTSLAQQAAGITIFGVASGRCGWLMHEGGHYSLTGHIPTDRGLQIVLYGVGCGMSGSWWRNQHNKHHSMPQKIGHDVDLNTLPLVAFTSKVVKKIGVNLKSWIALQAYLFPLITTFLVATGWQFYLHPRHIVRTKNIYEGASLITRLALWTYFITGTFGLKNSALIYFCYNWVASNYIFINFAVSHTHLDTVDKEDTQVDWVRYAAYHTMNVSPGPLKFVDWWMSYLNYQIEHHLFPSMPQFRHPIVSNRIRELFKKHDIRYDQRDYLTSMYVTFKNLSEVGVEVGMFEG